jgi:uncharacterized protein involved in high-affinity Fe2+ transport
MFTWPYMTVAAALAASGSMDTVSIAPAVLDPGNTYTFSVRVENFVGKYSTASFTVTKAGADNIAQHVWAVQVEIRSRTCSQFFAC